MGKDTTEAIISFFTSGKLIKELNHTFITLVSKRTNASQSSDYRPISCCNTLYKFITKILANRLQRVIDGLICENQHAFLRQAHFKSFSTCT